MPTDRELVVYTRTSFCPYQAQANRVFSRYGLTPRTILIDGDRILTGRVETWTGFRSVPTIIVAAPGSDQPLEQPAPLPPGASPRGIDRGYMITEAREDELEAWLLRHGFIETIAER